MLLHALIHALWLRRWRLAACAALLVLAGGALILLWPRSYLAETVIAPAETTGFATSSLLSPMPMLQSGLLDMRPGGNFAIYLGALRSPEAAQALAEHTALATALAARRAAAPLGPLRRMLGLRQGVDRDDLLRWLERHLAVTQNVASVTWSLSVDTPDPGLARAILVALHRFAEEKVRHDLAALAEQRVQAIEARLPDEPDLFQRSALYELLGQQQRAALVVAAEQAVAARVVAAPMVEFRPSLPNRPLLLGLLLLAAPMAVLGVAAAALLARATAVPEGPPQRAAALLPVQPRHALQPPRTLSASAASTGGSAAIGVVPEAPLVPPHNIRRGRLDRRPPSDASIARSAPPAPQPALPLEKPAELSGLKPGTVLPRYVGPILPPKDPQALTPIPTLRTGPAAAEASRAARAEAAE